MFFKLECITSVRLAGNYVTNYPNTAKMVSLVVVNLNTMFFFFNFILNTYTQDSFWLLFQILYTKTRGYGQFCNHNKHAIRSCM